MMKSQYSPSNEQELESCIDEKIKYLDYLQKVMERSNTTLESWISSQFQDLSSKYYLVSHLLNLDYFSGNILELENRLHQIKVEEQTKKQLLHDIILQKKKFEDRLRQFKTQKGEDSSVDKLKSSLAHLKTQKTAFDKKTKLLSESQVRYQNSETTLHQTEVDLQNRENDLSNLQEELESIRNQIKEKEKEILHLEDSNSKTKISLIEMRIVHNPKLIGIDRSTFNRDQTSKNFVALQSTIELLAADIEDIFHVDMIDFLLDVWCVDIDHMIERIHYKPVENMKEIATNNSLFLKKYTEFVKNGIIEFVPRCFESNEIKMDKKIEQICKEAVQLAASFSLCVPKLRFFRPQVGEMVIRSEHHVINRDINSSAVVRNIKIPGIKLLQTNRVYKKAVVTTDSVED